MALNVSPCWTLILGACLALTVNGDCEKDCELCLFHLKGRQTDLSLFTCLQECEGIATTAKSLDLCKDVLEGNPADPGQGSEEQPDRHHGGFLRKTSEVGGAAAGGTGKRYGGFMKRDDGSRLDALKELLAALSGGEEGGDSEELGGDVKAPQKRYGGFMRRVGSPAWEDSKKTYEGFRKRSWGSDSQADSLLQEKRYGGFMD